MWSTNNHNVGLDLGTWSIYNRRGGGGTLTTWVAWRWASGLGGRSDAIVTTGRAYETYSIRSRKNVVLAFKLSRKECRVVLSAHVSSLLRMCQTCYHSLLPTTRNQPNMSVLVCTVAPLVIVEVCKSFFPLLGTLTRCNNVYFYETEHKRDWERTEETEKRKRGAHLSPELGSNICGAKASLNGCFMSVSCILNRVPHKQNCWLGRVIKWRSFIRWERSFIPMKFLWLGYLVYSLGNCVIKLCIETGLSISLVSCESNSNSFANTFDILVFCQNSQNLLSNSLAIRLGIYNKLANSSPFLAFMRVWNRLGILYARTFIGSWQPHVSSLISGTNTFFQVKITKNLEMLFLFSLHIILEVSK